MATVQDRTPAASAELSGRELRRVVALVLAAEGDRRVIAPLSVMIPGMTDADGRQIRDATIRARVQGGDGIAALCADGRGEVLVVSESMLAGPELRVAPGEDELFVRALAGSRVPLDAVRRAADGDVVGPMRGEPVFGLVVTRRPFGAEAFSDADIVGVNGGILGVALCALAPAGGEEVTILRDGAVVQNARVPAGEAVWGAALAGCAEAVRSCAPLAERLMGAGSYFSHPLGEPVLALTMGDAVALRPGSAVGLDVSGGRVATVVCTTAQNLT